MIKLFDLWLKRIIDVAYYMEQELPTLPEHMSSPPVFSGIRVTRSLVLCVCFVDRYLSFCTFSFGHSVLQYADSDYPVGIFKFLLAILINFFLYKLYLFIMRN